jgi:hypothetical protein
VKEEKIQNKKKTRRMEAEGIRIKSHRWVLPR